MAGRLAQEQRLVARARRGDAAAFEVLVTEYAQYVHNLALRVVRDPQEAEDIAQEAFLRAWKGLPGFRGGSRFSTWLYRIATNLCYNRLPAMKRSLSELDPENAAVQVPDGRTGPEARLDSRELMAALVRAVDDLPEGYRLLITLRHTQGLPYQEIAEVTGLPLGTVKTNLFRARAQLRERLQQYEESYEPV